MSEKPVLYYLMMSPPCRSVLLTAAALDVELELKVVNVSAGEQLEPEFLAMNPQHTIPFLDDNGVHVADSHAICTYLCEKYGADDSLYPKDLIKRTVVDSRLHFDSGHLFPRLRSIVLPLFRGICCEISSEKIDDVNGQWEIMEGMLANGLYLYGDDMTIADLCCIATVSSLTELVPIDAEKYPNFTQWIERLMELPYYEEKNGDGARALQTLALEKCQASE